MSKKYFLKLDGVRGESDDPRHPEEMELTTLYFKTGHAGAGNGRGGAGRAQLADISVTKRSDTTSPLLRLASASGQHFRYGLITIEDIGDVGNAVRFVTISMKDIMIPSFRGNHDQDEVTFNFGDYKFAEGKFAQQP